MFKVNEISSISHAEMVELRSTLHALTNTGFICSVCQSKFGSRADGERMLTKTKKLKGCEEIRENQLHFIMQGNTKLKYNTCVGNFVNDSSIYWINFYNHFEKGVMPFPGGYMDQPSKVIDVMSIIGNHKNNEMLKQAQRNKQSSRNSMRMLKGGRQ